MPNDDADKKTNLPYVMNDREEKAARRVMARAARGSEAPRMKVDHDGDGVRFQPDHPNAGVAYGLYMDAFGTDSEEFLFGHLQQLYNCAVKPGGEVDIGKLNYILSFIKGRRPNDEMETMVTTQIAIVGMASMKAARQLFISENALTQDSSQKMLNNCARTVAKLVETLNDYRSNADARMVAQQPLTSKDITDTVEHLAHRGKGETPALDYEDRRRLTADKNNPMPVLSPPGGGISGPQKEERVEPTRVRLRGKGRGKQIREDDYDASA